MLKKSKVREEVSEIKGEKLSIGYDETIIVSDLSIEVKQNEITTIIGPNGCGKSTLLKALTRMLKHNQGQVTLNGKDIYGIGTKELARKMAILAQHQGAPMDMSVEELVHYGRMPYQKWYEVESEEDEQIVQWAMSCTGIEYMRKRRLASLSGGERQRAWIATALAQKPDFLFLDEPTTYLDISHQLEIMQLLNRLKEQLKIGIVMVLHDLQQALTFSDTVIVMKEGQKVAYGRPKEIMTSELLAEVYNVQAEIIQLPQIETPIIIYETSIEEQGGLVG